MRNLKILGLAFVAILAMSAIGASAASANQLTAEAYPTTLTGAPEPETTDVFATTAGNVSCKKVTYGATLSAAATTVTVTPSYNECTALGFPATIDMNGCNYLFHAEAGASSEATADLVCPGEVKEVVVTANPAAHGLTPKCTIRVAPQTGLSTITLTNTGSGTTREITINVNITNIKYSHTAGTGLGACTSGSAINGKLTAKALATGESGSTHRGIFMSNV